MKRLICLSLLLAACSSSPAGPKGKDPTTLVVNQRNDYAVVLTWYDQSGQVSRTVVAPLTQQCVHFTGTLPADSVRFVAFTGDSAGHGESMQVQTPWFDPATGIVPSSPGSYPFGAEYWTLTSRAMLNGSPIGAGSAILMATDSTAPC